VRRASGATYGYEEFPVDISLAWRRISDATRGIFASAAVLGGNMCQREVENVHDVVSWIHLVIRCVWRILSLDRTDTSCGLFGR
jgi:hypothetical protein